MLDLKPTLGFDPWPLACKKNLAQAMSKRDCWCKDPPTLIDLRKIGLLNKNRMQ